MLGDQSILARYVFKLNPAGHGHAVLFKQVGANEMGTVSLPQPIHHLLEDFLTVQLACALVTGQVSLDLADLWRVERIALGKGEGCGLLPFLELLCEGLTLPACAWTLAASVGTVFCHVCVLSAVGPRSLITFSHP